MEDEDAKTPLGVLMKVSRERELEAAIAEQREPRLPYPAIPLEEVRYEINGLLQLYEDVGQQEPNIIVRRLYQGAVTPPQTFLSVATFFKLLTLLHSRLNYPDVEEQKAQTYARAYALSLTLRTYRGVPDLERTGVCYLQDAVYLRGLHLIEQAVAEDQTVLERLAVGMCSLEALPDLQELGITTPPTMARKTRLRS